MSAEREPGIDGGDIEDDMLRMLVDDMEEAENARLVDVMRNQAASSLRSRESLSPSGLIILLPSHGR